MSVARLAGLALLAPFLALAQEGGREAVSPLTAQAVKDFSSGNKAAACVSAAAALRQNPSDEKALGIARMTCGEKGIDKLEYKKRRLKTHEEAPDALKPQPLSGRSNTPESARAEDGLPSRVVEAAAPEPGFREEASTYEKLVEAKALLSQGKPGEAAQAAARAVELQPRNRQAYDVLASANRLLGHYRQVIYVADLGLKSFPNDPDLLKNKIFALNKQGDYAAALAEAQKAMAFNATDPVLHALRAYALGRGGDREGMLQALETAAALDPNFAPLLLQARGPSDGEPFLMPGDSREQARPAPRRRRSAPPLGGLLIIGGLIVLLLVILGLLIHGLAHRNGGEES